MADTKLSEAALAKLLGKTTPLPGGAKQISPQLIPQPAAPAASAPVQQPAKFDPQAGPAVLQYQLNEAEKGMKKGGKVKKSAGGSVRGCGIAQRGLTKGRFV